MREHIAWLCLNKQNPCTSTSKAKKLTFFYLKSLKKYHVGVLFHKMLKYYFDFAKIAKSLSSKKPYVQTPGPNTRKSENSEN